MVKNWNNVKWVRLITIIFNSLLYCNDVEKEDLPVKLRQSEYWIWKQSFIFRENYGKSCIINGFTVMAKMSKCTFHDAVLKLRTTKKPFEWFHSISKGSKTSISLYHQYFSTKWRFNKSDWIEIYLVNTKN